LSGLRRYRHFIDANRAGKRDAHPVPRKRRVSMGGGTLLEMQHTKRQDQQAR
jgi:hypothetical protein